MEYNDVRRHDIVSDTWRDGDWLHILEASASVLADPDSMHGIRHVAAENTFLGYDLSEDEWRAFSRLPAWREIESLLLRYQYPNNRERFDIFLQSPMLEGIRRLDLSHSHIDRLLPTLATATQLEQLRELGLMGQDQVELEQLRALLEAPHIEKLEMLRLASSDLPDGALELLRDFHDRTGCAVDVLGQNRDIGYRIEQRIQGGSAEPLDTFMERVRERTRSCIQAHSQNNLGRHAEQWRALVRLLDRAGDIQYVTHHALPYVLASGLELPRRYPVRGAQWPPNTPLFWRLAHGASPLTVLYPALDLFSSEEPPGSPFAQAFHGFTAGCGLLSIELEAYSQGRACELITPIITSPNLENLEVLSWRDRSPDHEYRHSGLSGIEAFTALVVNNPALCNLRTLDILDSGFDDASAELLAGASNLKHLTHIKALPGEDGQMARITDEGLFALANSPLMDTLQVLDIGLADFFEAQFTQRGLDAIQSSATHEVTFYSPYRST